MARIAYVDHSYHAKTGSTQFLADMLRKRGHRVDFFWDDKWKGAAAIPFSQVAEYDAVIMFQVRCASRQPYFRRIHPNITYIPMLDAIGIHYGPRYNLGWYWESVQGCKILSFSAAVHNIATGFGLRSFFVRYYPPPGNRVPPAYPPRAFFWIRHEDMISWPIVRELLRGAIFNSVHLHVAPDPGTPAPTLPSEVDKNNNAIVTSTWFAEKRDFLDILNRTNVFFAPRREEGIGQSFLEAMARGQCVVAPDNGTMNEYILHGVNGLLYDPDHPSPLDFSRFAELGETARESVIVGHERWLAAEENLEKFILTSSQEAYHGFYQHEFIQEKAISAQEVPEHVEVPSMESTDSAITERQLPEYSIEHLLHHYNRLRNSKWRKIGVFLGLTNNYPKPDKQ